MECANCGRIEYPLNHPTVLSKMADLLQCVEWRIEGDHAGILCIDGDLDTPLRLHRKEITDAYGIDRRTPFSFGIWNRLWMDSLLSPQRITVLKRLFSDYLPQSDWERNGLALFRSALNDAETEGRKLEVSLTPPGHSDFGRITTFAHCPRCKVAVSSSVVPPDTAAEVVCELCGTAFRPSDTYSSMRMTIEEESGPGR